MLFPVEKGGQTEWCNCWSFPLALAGGTGCEAAGAVCLVVPYAKQPIGLKGSVAMRESVRFTQAVRSAGKRMDDLFVAAPEHPKNKINS